MSAPDTMTGSYELRDLDHAYVGQLYEGKLVIDKTYGHAAYGCGSCCGYYGTVLNPAAFGGPPNIDFGEIINATESCGGYVDDVTDAGYNWGSSNTAVALLPSSTLHTVAVGSATGSAKVQLESNHRIGPGGDCQTTTWGPTQPVNVTPTVTIQGNGYCTSGTTRRLRRKLTPFLAAVTHPEAPTAGHLPIPVILSITARPLPSI